MRKILHIDCDCFFAAVEMRDNPDLVFEPIAIGGLAESRGVISTCNYVAREFGVRSAMSTTLAMKKCPRLILLPTHMPLYKKVSSQVMAIIQRFGVTFEQVSIDEAYLEVDPSDSAIDVGHRIRKAVEEEVGITVSVGAAPNKFLAKVASDWNKPNGLFAIKPHQVERFVEQLPVSKIPGIGPKTTERLASRDIVFCIDVHSYSLLELVDWFGRAGASLYQRSRGVDNRALIVHRERKTISVEQTFAMDLYSEADLNVELVVLWERLVKRIDRAGVNWSGLSPFIKIKFNDFSQITLSDHLMLTNLATFQQLLERARVRHTKEFIKGIRLIGLGGRCVIANEQQLTLF